MDHWTDHSFWREHREELLREAQERRLEREARKTRGAFVHARKRPGAVEVRWGLPKDEAKVARLLDLNGMPRWVAFEERFVVAEQGDELLAAVRYRTEPKRLLLGLLVADPWPARGGFGERRLAVTLYAGARGLALELGAREIVAKTDRIGADYLQEAGYRRWGGGWRLDTARPARPRYKSLEGRRPGWGRLAGALVAALFPPGKSPAGLGEGIGYRTRRDAEGPKGRVGPDAKPERCPDDRA